MIAPPAAATENAPGRAAARSDPDEHARTFAAWAEGLLAKLDAEQIQRTHAARVGGRYHRPSCSGKARVTVRFEGTRRSEVAAGDGIRLARR